MEEEGTVEEGGYKEEEEEEVGIEGLEGVLTTPERVPLAKLEED